jgi:2-(1,2-epoxy-1,2-dihydrophenyl)acetyl-CoA isomerase
MYETINFEVKNNVGWLTLNRPDKLNAFNDQMRKEVTKAVKETSKNNEIRCLVISSEGRAFCSGQDLSDIKEDADHGELLRNGYNPMVEQLYQLEKPVIAAVNGVAAGAGMSLAIACDFRLAHEKASFIAAFIHVGLVPDTGQLYTLPRIVGHAKAFELAVLGEKISAQEAMELGLVTKLISDDRWQEEVALFAERLAIMPTKAIGLIKRYLNESWNASFEQMLENEANGQRVAGLTDDHKEGVLAFIEKRKPQFRGY